MIFIKYLKESLGFAVTIGSTLWILLLLINLLFVDYGQIREPNMVILWTEIIMVFFGLIFAYKFWIKSFGLIK